MHFTRPGMASAAPVREDKQLQAGGALVTAEAPEIFLISAHRVFQSIKSLPNINFF